MTLKAVDGALMDRAALAGLMARGFAYPDESFRQSVSSGKFESDVRAVSRAAGLERAAEALGPALSEPALSEPYALAGEHTHLFERSVLCPFNEASYLGAQGLAAVRELADVASLYNVFGYKVSSRAGELADSLPVELEFLGVLYAKEAYARERGWKAKAKISADVRATFLKEHLGLWLPKFGERLRKHARLLFYPALASLAEGLVSIEQDGRAGAAE